MGAPNMELRRVREDAPTAPGWYYGKYIAGQDPRYGVRPFKVVEDDRDGVLVTFTGARELSLFDFEWYGPVPVCVEAGSKP